MQNNYFLLILFFSAALFSQTEKMIHGKIIVKNSKLEGVRVINLVNEKETVTNNKGEFSILAKPDDLLVFSAEFLDYMRKIVEVSDYSNGFLEIEMTSKALQLDEVVIHDYSSINAVSLGILSKPAQVYTPAERRLRTATAAYPTFYAGNMAGGSIGLDPLINWVTGRTAMLKKALKAEEKQILLQKLSFYYSEQYFRDNLKIESLSIESFKNYAVYDSVLIEAINTKNKARMEFNLHRLALQFKKINEHEN